MQSASYLYPVCFSVVFSVAFAYPAGPVYSKPYSSSQGAYYNPNQAYPSTYQGNDKEARIISSFYDLNPQDSSFKYAYETDNGISVDASGFIKGESGQTIQGSFLLLNAEGKPSKVTYIADENGYQPSGDAIPTTPPEIAKAVAYLLSLPSTTPPPQYYSKHQGLKPNH